MRNNPSRLITLSKKIFTINAFSSLIPVLIR